MKRFLFLLFVLLFCNQAIASDITYNVYSENNSFGLEDSLHNKITKPEFKKLIRVGDDVWLVQVMQRYGLIDNSGSYIVKPKYRHAERYLGKYVKLGNDNDFGVYDGQGNIVIPNEYSYIDLLYGRIFLTCKNFKYGVTDSTGKILLENKFDEIYMPDKNIMRVLYNGEWYEFSKVPSDVDIDEKTKIIVNDSEVTIVKKVLSDTGVMSGYCVISGTNYAMKTVSSISPSYESTVDDLMLSHGVDTVERIKNPIWIVQFPYIYTKKYFNNWIAPSNGPLARIKQNLRKKIR